MATPTGFKETNHVLGAGDNPNTDQLPVAICTNRDTQGVACIVSCWKLSPEELAEINKTGQVWLSVMAPITRPTQSPVWVMGTDPFKQGFEPLEL